MEFTGCEYKQAYSMDGYSVPTQMPMLVLNIDGNNAQLKCGVEPVSSFSLNSYMRNTLARQCDENDVALVIFGLTPDDLISLEPSAKLIKHQAEANSFVVGYQHASKNGKSVTLIVFKGSYGWIKVSPPSGTNFFYLSTPNNVSKLSTNHHESISVCNGCITSDDLMTRCLCISDDKSAGLLMVNNPIVFPLAEDTIPLLSKDNLALLSPAFGQIDMIKQGKEWKVLGINKGNGTTSLLLNKMVVSS